MSIEFFPTSGGGTDWSKYTPIDSFANSVSVAAAATVVIYSATGKGYLRSCTGYGTTADYSNLRITVDGVIKYYGRMAASTSNIAGIFNSADLKDNGASVAAVIPVSDGSAAYVTMASLASFPYTAATATTYRACVLSRELFFNTSLLIEAVGITTNTVFVRTRGGLLV